MEVVHQHLPLALMPTEPFVLLTRLVPVVSHFPKLLGKAGKSTARMQRTVMSIIWARQTVTKGL